MTTRDEEIPMASGSRKRRITALDIVDIIVGVAIVMILCALIIPFFVPPEGAAASSPASHHSINPLKRR
jgi:hypothetical protein